MPFRSTIRLVHSSLLYWLSAYPRPSDTAALHYTWIIERLLFFSFPVMSCSDLSCSYGIRYLVCHVSITRLRMFPFSLFLWWLWLVDVCFVVLALLHRRERIYRHLSFFSVLCLGCFYVDVDSELIVDFFLLFLWGFRGFSSLFSSLSFYHRYGSLLCCLYEWTSLILSIKLSSLSSYYYNILIYV